MVFIYGEFEYAIRIQVSHLHQKFTSAPTLSPNDFLIFSPPILDDAVLLYNILIIIFNLASNAINIIKNG